MTTELIGIFAVMMLPMIGIAVSLWLSWKHTDDSDS